MSESFSLVFDMTTGNGKCLHTDAIPLQELGRLSMERASNVEWCEVSQTWAVITLNRPGAPAKILFSDPSRAECLAWERRNWERLVA